MWVNQSIYFETGELAGKLISEQYRYEIRNSAGNLLGSVLICRDKGKGNWFACAYFVKVKFYNLCTGDEAQAKKAALDLALGKSRDIMYALQAATAKEAASA